MNCRETEQAILLAGTGELSDRKLKALELHLATCASCAQYRHDALRIMAAAREPLPASEPSTSVMTRIRAAAKARPVSKIIIFRRPVLQVLAYAAALALLIGGWFLVSTSRQPQSSSINDVMAILTVMSGTTPPALEARDDSSREQELRALARELLLLEGMIEEERAEPGIEEGVPTSDGELSPTVLRWRSTPFSPRPVCG